MESVDIRYAETPVSLGAKGAMHRRPGKGHLGNSTSTPFVESTTSKPRLFLGFRGCAMEPEESPIPLMESQVKVNLAEAPVFDRKPAEESNKLSITAIAASLGKLKLCDSSHSQLKSIYENLMDIKKEPLETNSNGEDNSSSLHEHREIKKHLKKNQNKSHTPKYKSPKVYKVGIGKIRCVNIGTLTKKKKSPKIECVNKSGGTIKKEDVTILSNKVTTSNQKNGVSGKSSSRTTPTRSGSNHPKLKILKYSKSPKLHTANRAEVWQRKEELRKLKEKEMEMKKLKILEDKQRQEEECISKIRQQTLFRASSIRKYKPLPIVKKRLLTDPISPQIYKRRRIEMSAKNGKSKSNKV